MKNENLQQDDNDSNMESECEIPEELLEENIIGIDLGTTNTCVAIWRNNNVEIISDKHGNRTIPSYVAYSNYHRYVGYDAKNLKDLNPSNVFYEVKRLIGRKMDDPLFVNEKEFFSYNMQAGEHGNVMLVPELINKRQFSPEEISAAVLMEAKKMASDYLKEPVKKCIITVPAYFNDGQRQATKDAAEIAGLECIRIINEPIAAALAYGLFQRSQYEYQSKLTELRKKKEENKKDTQLNNVKLSEYVKNNKNCDEEKNQEDNKSENNEIEDNDDNQSKCSNESLNSSYSSYTESNGSTHSSYYNSESEESDKSEQNDDNDSEEKIEIGDVSKTVIVYDLGGGTLDVSLLRIENGLFEVIAYGGNSRMGGSDFDNRLMSVCINVFKQQHKIKTEITEISKLSLQKLRLICESTKKVLSNVMKTRIAIKDFYDGKDLNFTITRQDYEEMCNDLFLICLRPVDELLRETEINVSEIDEIILVGGMTRMPMIRKLLKQKFGKEPNCTINPDEAVAAGASIQGYLLSHKEDPFSESVVLMDATALSLGVDSDGGTMSKIIERGEMFPIKRSKMYSTDADNVDSVIIKVYEGERDLVDDNFFVGEFELKGIDPAPIGIPEIEVEFSIDINGLITVTAQNKKNHETSSLTVTSNKARLTRAQIETLIEEARELEIQDALEKRKKLMHYEIELFCRNIIKNIEIKEIKLSQSSKDAVILDVNNILNWLKEKKSEDREDEEYETVIKNLKNQYGTLILHGYIGSNDLKNAEEQGNKNGTTVYGNDDDDAEEEINNIFEKLEEKQLGYKGMSDPEKEELKELRYALHDLCHSILGIASGENLKISDQHIEELKDFINEVFMWFHAHEKPTKIDYIMKIDEVNKMCDKLFDHYNDKNEELFKNDELFDSIKNKRDELENLCLVLKLMIIDKSFPVENELLDPLIVFIEETLEWIYKSDEDVKGDNDKINKYNNECGTKLEDINEKCNTLYQKMQGIHLDTFKTSLKKESIVLTGVVEENKNCMSGTSIIDLMRSRQQEILVNKINAKAKEFENSDDYCNNDNEYVEEIIIG